MSCLFSVRNSWKIKWVFLYLILNLRVRRIITCQIDEFYFCIHQAKKQNKREVVLFYFVLVEGII